VVPDGPWANGADPDTTNQRMELAAALEALRALPGEVEIVSDSTYVVNCFRDRWWEGWLKRGWKNSQKKPVANRDLWEPLISLYREREGEIFFTWVKGHDGDEWNDVADRLAVEASTTLEGREGTGRPIELGPADFERPAADIVAVAPGADGVYGSAWRPRARSVVVVGLQPPELGGYDENPVAAGVRRTLTEILAAKRELDPELVVLTGLRLGAETLAAEAARAGSIPYVAVLPFPDPDAKWPTASRRRFAELLEDAAAVVRLERKGPTTPQQAGQALDRRNGWLRKVADEAVVVWDGSDRRVGRLVADLERDLGDDVWVIGP
jgi:ribonuclease HI/uncharacterized phage-like protein YoqJ